MIGLPMFCTILGVLILQGEAESEEPLPRPDVKVRYLDPPELTLSAIEGYMKLLNYPIIGSTVDLIDEGVTIVSIISDKTQAWANEIIGLGKLVEVAEFTINPSQVGDTFNETDFPKSIILSVVGVGDVIFTPEKTYSRKTHIGTISTMRGDVKIGEETGYFHISYRMGTISGTGQIGKLKFRLSGDYSNIKMVWFDPKSTEWRCGNE